MQKLFSNLINFSLLLAVLTGVLFFSGAVLSDAAGPDAIAVRVMANDNNYSAVRWYKEQKFSGAPQNLQVDGYEAVRDGRTVYVNAANINAGNFYTQIYIISFNQAAEPSTVDIFGQILSHWKFNSNSDPESNFNGKAGVCSVSDKTSCIYTSDCPAKEYCLSDKAKLIRDTKRLADLANLKSYLETYSKKNDYPRLAAGSYIASSSVSVWPSWQATLAKELGVILPLDPINKLEPCAASGYDEKTCWDQATKNFYFNFNSDSTADKSIAQSAVYWYQNGEFNVNLETKAKYKNLEKIGGVNFSNLDTSLRFEPALHEITAVAGQNFQYQIRVYDPFLANQNLYNLDWTVENPGSTLQINISKTAVSNIAKITGTVQSGQNRAFVVKIKVTDKRVNEPLEGNFTITAVPNCDNKTGYHLENGTCVQCPINTQTTESVGWVSGKCAATVCQNEEENSGFHAEGGICKSNTDIYFCPKPEGVSGLTRYWNSSADNWGDCQITSCWTDKGYHLENGQCVQCRAANAASVKWDSASNACQATICQDQNSNSGYHIDAGLCLSNTENNSSACSSLQGAKDTVRYWNAAEKKWGDCQITMCDTANGYYLSSGKCITCGAGKHLENEACAANTRACTPAVTNAKANSGTETWLGYTLKWGGSCLGFQCQPEYPDYVVNYKLSNPIKPACVNACGSADITENIHVTFGSLTKFYDGATYLGRGYVNDLKYNIYDSSLTNVIGRYNSGLCGKDILTKDFDQSQLVSSNGQKCQLSYRYDMDDSIANTYSCTGGNRCYNNVYFKEENQCINYLWGGFSVSFFTRDNSTIYYFNIDVSGQMNNSVSVSPLPAVQFIK